MSAPVALYARLRVTTMLRLPGSGRPIDSHVLRPITMGRSADDGVEVLSGLNAGETFASAGSFVIKAQLGKGEAGHEEE